MEEIRPVSKALPAVSLFALYIPSIFAHKKVEAGLCEMETAVFGGVQKSENTTIGTILLGISLVSLPIGFIAAFLPEDIGELLMFIPAALSFALLIFAFWLWRSCCRQRDRLVRLAEALGVPVVDVRGLNMNIGCVGTWMWWLVVLTLLSWAYITLGPVVRQYRTVDMFNEVAFAFNQAVQNADPQAD